MISHIRWLLQLLHWLHLALDIFVLILDPSAYALFTLLRWGASSRGKNPINHWVLNRKLIGLGPHWAHGALWSPMGPYGPNGALWGPMGSWAHGAHGAHGPMGPGGRAGGRVRCNT